ncbi:MAG: Two component transcriptional regulator, winged helix family [Candidatus Curtissbacteria bacterium GW2011_GWA1_40_16]|uniref:Two component transcriptional regulator, winged helix family n=1 Tax=Candidatus Curtissbacteria bacterium GW2011_GWA1_40_16 TaxID=1618405 RepID=A0A0G0REI0_9BACT|nr:MAG: Two component transcriptional regulator, winged helix family [Candidatus Curtissbacteria bacterium GW2011_GWA1_40_16]
MSSSVLIVEDDENQREVLIKLLVDDGFSVNSAGTGAEAIKFLEKFRPDIVLLDLGLPDISGETVLSASRKMYPDLPVIILTARGTSADVVSGFRLGADDYVSKPYNIDEILARIKARLNRLKTSDKLVVGDLEINEKTFEVRRAGRKITLTPKEFKLLEYLMVNKGQVLSRDMILSRVWMYSPDMETRAVDVYIGYLRRKVDKGFKKSLIQSVRGYGYMLRD